MKKVFSLIIFFLQFSLIYLIFISSFKDSVMGVYFEGKQYINAFFPQGWGFFTKDPREKMIELHIEENGHLKRIDFLNNSALNYFGLTRKSRRIGMDVSIIYEQTKVHTFYEDFQHIPKGITISGEYLYLQESLKNKDIYILEKEWMPWAWYQSSAKTIKNIKYLAFTIQ